MCVSHVCSYFLLIQGLPSDLRRFPFHLTSRFVCWNLYGYFTKTVCSGRSSKIEASVIRQEAVNSVHLTSVYTIWFNRKFQVSWFSQITQKRKTLYECSEVKMFLLHLDRWYYFLTFLYFCCYKISASRSELVLGISVV